MNNTLHWLTHPVLQHKLSILRQRTTSSAEVRRIVGEMAVLLAYEATRDLTIDTQAADHLKRLPWVVSILRAGNSMLDGVLMVLPEAEVGHIGIYRDRFTQNTIEYYFRLPDGNRVEGRSVILLDPLVATGDTVLAIIERLKQFKTGALSILCILISQSALERIQYFYPEVMVYTLGVEENLDEQGFLVPGIGDISSRLFGWA